MPEAVVTYALTTKARIKNKLGITVTDHDTILDRLISSYTDLIESQTNRRFKRTTYTNEVYSVRAKQDFLFLRQTPVISIASFQYRTGLPNAITWADVSAAEYELSPDQETGMIECYFHLQQGPNQYRVTYTAGYLIDFDTVGASTHTLPLDISELCEKLVIKAFKRREKHGLASESFDGNQTSWQKEMDPEDEATIARYRRTLII